MAAEIEDNKLKNILNSNDEFSKEENLTEWENEPSVRDLKSDYTEALPDHKNQTQKIDRWLDNLNITGSAKPKTPKGQSGIVPQLIRKQAEWRYSALSEPFLSTEEIFDIDPVTFKDKKAAEQNELVLNNQFNTQINKTKFIDEYIRTAVDEGTVIVRVGWDFEEEEVEEEVPEVSFKVNPEKGPLHQELNRQQQEEPERFEAETPEELKEANRITNQTGNPIEAEITNLKKETRTKTVRNRPTLNIVPYDNVILDPTAQGDPEKMSFIIYSFETSMAELEKDGKYNNLDQINPGNNDILSQPDHQTENNSNFNFSDETRKKFVAFEYWGFWDTEGNGKLTPIVATWVGNTMIRLEENPFPDKQIPFVVVQYLPVRRSLYGEPDGALLEDNQKIQGAVTRGMIDIMGRAANGQTGVRKDALDATNQRKFERGEDYEFNANVHPDQAIYMHTWPEIPNSAQFMLQLQNQDAEALTGVKAFSQGIEGDNLGESATAARGALDAASKRELGILRRLSDGMTQIGRKIIAMNAEFLSEQEVVRRTDEQFVPIKRDDLPGNFDLKLSISTPEADQQKSRDLSFMLQTMGNNMDANMSSMILSEIAHLKKMPKLAKKIENFEPQPDPVEQQKQKAEIQKLQAEIQKIQSEVQENEASAQLDTAKAKSEIADAENKDSDTDQKNLDFVEQESGIKQEREVEQDTAQAQAQAEANAGLKAVEASLEDAKNQKQNEESNTDQNSINPSDNSSNSDETEGQAQLREQIDQFL